MKQVLYLSIVFILLMGVSFPSFCQEINLEGAWSLTQAEIQKVENNGELINLPYQKGLYDNPNDCIFSELKFEKDNQCICMDDKIMEYSMKYTIEKENKLTIWFSALVTLNFSIEAGNQLHISREYSRYDITTWEIITMKVHLIYSKI